MQELKDTTDEFSFELNSSKYGIGVFCTHGIKIGTQLRLFGENNPIRLIKINEIPEEFKKFCVMRNELAICPSDFGHIPIGWYLNHNSMPTATRNTKEIGKYEVWVASRNILKGEEITIDYNDLDEPEYQKEDFYTCKN